mmetsp:Transcript_17405/g.66303  ORF Transcript_17405/g.66303 Transcript_17405/m.66303 type:complete len:232 (-) Transcript_17405:173-868(-)
MRLLSREPATRRGPNGPNMAGLDAAGAGADADSFSCRSSASSASWIRFGLVHSCTVDLIAMSTNAWLGAVAVGDGLGELGDGAGDGIGAAISSRRKMTSLNMMQFLAKTSMAARPSLCRSESRAAPAGLPRLGLTSCASSWAVASSSSASALKKRKRLRRTSIRGFSRSAKMCWSSCGGGAWPPSDLHASSAASYTSGGSSGGSSAPREYRSTSMRNTGSLEPFRGRERVS